MKTIGFLTGGALAALALVAFTMLTGVTDNDRLQRMLAECVSYVATGETPFAGEGRNLGVYDAPLFEGDYVADTHRILDDGRFEAAWETVLDVESPIRLCRVTARFDGGNQRSFSLDQENFIDRVTGYLAPFGDLQPQSGEVPDGLSTLAWTQPGKSPSEGLRVVMIVEPGHVASFFAAGDLDR